MKPPAVESHADGASGPATAEPVRFRDFLRLFTAVMLPMFLAAIDQTLLATATPAIAAELGGLRDTTWIALGYLIATMVTVPLYGRLGDRYGRARMLLVALGGFALGSAVCATAGSMLHLVIGRIVQGLGAGGLMVMSQALIGELVPPRQRPRFQGWFAANFTLSSITGPVVGGFVVSHFSWRWLFIANVPLVALAMWRVARLPAAPPARTEPAFDDKLGVLLFVATTVPALLWLTFAGHRFAWLSVASFALSVPVLVLGIWLVRRERAARAPFLPVELLRVPGVPAITATVSLFASCFFACIFFLPIALQVGAGAQAAHAGLMLLPITLGMVLGATITGRIVAYTHRTYPIPVGGMAVSSVALATLATFPSQGWMIAALGVACGMGFGTVMPTSQLALQTLAGRARLGAAAAVVSLSRSVGAVTGTAVFGALVYGLLHGVDLDAALHGGSAAERAVILRAFQWGFVASAVLAAVAAFTASLAPRVRL